MSRLLKTVDKIRRLATPIAPENTLHPHFSVINERVDENSHDQRIDNFLFKRYRDVPKSHIYQLLRSGQVRVNGKRVNASYRLLSGDVVRIPPIKREERKILKPVITPLQRINFEVLFEDDVLLVIDKPAGVAVHGGSGVSFGVIEQLRTQNPNWKFLELVHRLDRETSGVLMLAKKRSALVELHRQIREGLTEKHYLVLVKGEWHNARQHVRLALNKYVTAAGERRVAVSSGEHQAQLAHTVFTLHKSWRRFSLLDAELKTGRTHQIRVHLAHLGFPIAGDDKYGDFALNKQLAKLDPSAGLTRMFLHAFTMDILHPVSGERLQLKSMLAKDLKKFLGYLDTSLGK